MPHKVGDKVRVKRLSAGLSSDRGVVVGVGSGRLSIRLDATSTVLAIDPREVTNFSLAARKAWAHMPARNVGRPKGSKVCDRVTVTLRLDRDVWERFQQAEAIG